MRSRRTVWVIGALCALSTIGLVLVSLLVDLDTGDRVASIAGAAAGIVGCALSVYFGMQQNTSSRIAVQARGRGAVAAGRNATGNAVGKNSKVTRTAPSAGPTQPHTSRHGEISATGSGAAAAGYDATSNALGKGSEIEER
jgi:hypothetical protein